MAVGRTLSLLLASAALAAPAFAQTPPADPAGQGGGSGRWEERRADRDVGREAHDRQRTSDIALLLRLKPDQQATFQALEASMRPPEGRRGDGKRDGDAAAPQTTPKSLDRMQARMTEHEAAMRARLGATRRFYASLSPEQQGLFDALMRLRHGEGEGGRREHGFRGGPPMMRGEQPGMDADMGPPPPPPGV